MKRLALTALALTLFGCSPRDGGYEMTTHPAPAAAAHAGHGHHGGHAHHRGHGQGHATATLFARTEPAKAVAGQPVVLRLMLHDANGAMLNDFAAVHGAKVHLMVVRDGLDQFAHLHPQVDLDGHITARFTFPAGGVYRLYADFQPAGGPPTTATAELPVGGDAPPAPPLTPDVPGTASGDGLHARVDVHDTVAGREATIRFRLTDPAGRPVADLQPYMGERGHLTVLSRDGKQYVHAHPAADGNAGGDVVAFRAGFTAPGLYKGWGQFRWQDRVRVVPFVVNVN